MPFPSNALARGTFVGELLGRMDTSSHKEFIVSFYHNTPERGCRLAYLAILLPLISSEKGSYEDEKQLVMELLLYCCCW